MRVFTVVGEALVDLVADPVSPGSFTAHAGGSPYNVAVTLARLGAPVSLVARRGADAFGELLEAKLRTSGVALDAWEVSDAPTTLAVAAVDLTGQARYGFYLDGTAALTWQDSLERLRPAPGALHLGSLSSWWGRSGETVRALQRRVHRTGAVLISYDPNVRPALIADLAEVRAVVEESVARAHLIKASDEDVAYLYPQAELRQVAARWCGLGASLVVVTRGSAGAVAFGPGGELGSVAGLPITVADTVGAGDSFAGGLLAALGSLRLHSPEALRAAADARDPRLLAALEQAVTVSAMTCERPGADPPTAAELAARMA